MCNLDCDVRTYTHPTKYRAKCTPIHSHISHILLTCGQKSVQLTIYRHTFSFDVDHNCTAMYLKPRWIYIILRISLFCVFIFICTYLHIRIGASTQEKTKGLTLTLEKMAQVKDILSTLKGVLKLHVYP